MMILHSIPFDSTENQGNTGGSSKSNDNNNDGDGTLTMVNAMHDWFDQKSRKYRTVRYARFSKFGSRVFPRNRIDKSTVYSDRSKQGKPSNEPTVRLSFSIGLLVSDNASNERIVY